jgi:hypothetical protein
MAESREGILSALGQYARGAAAIPGQVAGYATDVIESEAPLQKVREDVTALGSGIGQAIAEDPVQFGLEMLPVVGNVMAFREAENLRQEATSAREEGDEDRAEGLEAAATYAISGVVPGGNILKALRKGAGDVVQMQQDPTTGTRTATLERPFKTRGRDFLETLESDFPEQDLIKRIQKAGLPEADTEILLQSITESAKDNKGRVSRYDLLDKYADKSIEDRTFIDIQEPDSSSRYSNMDNVHGVDEVGVVRLGVDYKNPVEMRGQNLFRELSDPSALSRFADDMGALETKISQLYEVNPEIADAFYDRKARINKAAKQFKDLDKQSNSILNLKYSVTTPYSVTGNSYMSKALDDMGISIDSWNDMMTFERGRAEGLLPEIQERAQKIAVGESFDKIKNADLTDESLGLRSYELRELEQLRAELDNIPSVESAFMFGDEELVKKLVSASEKFKDGEASLAKKTLTAEVNRIKRDLNRKGMYASEIGELPAEHPSLNIDQRNAVPLSFMRFVDTDSFMRDAKGGVVEVNPVMHVMELQSDYEDILRKRGPRGKGGRRGDVAQDDMLLGQQIELEVQRDDLINKKNDLLGEDTLDDPAFIADESQRKTFENLDRQLKSVENRIKSVVGQRRTINKRLSQEFEGAGEPAPYDVAELYPGQGARSQVQQINDMVAATLASIQRNKTGVTFPAPDPNDSAQSQLYSNVMNNAREAAKRLGPDFEVRVVETLVKKDVRGNDLPQQEFRKRVGIFHQDADTARKRAEDFGLQADADVDNIPEPQIGKGGQGVKMFEMGGIVSLPRQPRGTEGIADVIRKYRREGMMD